MIYLRIKTLIADFVATFDFIGDNNMNNKNMDKNNNTYFFLLRQDSKVVITIKTMENSIFIKDQLNGSKISYLLFLFIKN